MILQKHAVDSGRTTFFLKIFLKVSYELADMPSLKKIK